MLKELMSVVLLEDELELMYKTRMRRSSRTCSLRDRVSFPTVAFVCQDVARSGCLDTCLFVLRHVPS